MKTLRKADSRGTADFGWLKSRHSFSFGQYFDPKNTNWGPLRVINDDQVAPKAGFPAHPHRDMEIFSYVTKGSLAHKDSLGNQEILTPGRIQLMSAGTGIQHSEYNASDSEATHFLQIWIEPNTIGLEPSYQDLRIDPGSDLNKWRLLMQSVNDIERPDVLKIHQDAKVFVSKLQKGEVLTVPASQARKGYLHVVSGKLSWHGKEISTGDAIALEDEAAFQIVGEGDSELLYFDLPK